jgi:hypothetical protein
MATALQYQARRFGRWLRGLFRAKRSNVTINNYFTISSNHDPSRIARDVVERVAESRRFPGPPAA